MKWSLGRISECHRVIRILFVPSSEGRQDIEARSEEHVADDRPPKKVRCHDWPDKPGKGESLFSCFITQGVL